MVNEIGILTFPLICGLKFLLISNNHHRVWLIMVRVLVLVQLVRGSDNNPIKPSVVHVILLITLPWREINESTPETT